VECDNLVAEDIVSRGDVGWNGDRPGIVVGDQIIGSPFSWWGGAIDETTSIDLEEL
jgi:hypothetical protein